ncbi:hypothetical protein [Pseudorhodoferax sp.]|uniref:hypothetical protein n=1 Tax=Pseudorhodoferax sp. TaxID=1993553 RepID=UPI0039E51D99
MTPSTPSAPRSKPPAATAGAAVLGRAGWTVHAVAICLLAYLASARLVDVTGIVLRRAGMTFPDAVMAASMAGFLYLLLILLWAFSRRGVLRTWLCAGGLAGLALLGAWMLGGKP